MKPRKVPDNYLSGTGHLWEVWGDYGKGTTSQPVLDDSNNRAVFLKYYEAQDCAFNCCDAQPGKRFKVVDAASVAALPVVL